MRRFEGIRPAMLVLLAITAIVEEMMLGYRKRRTPLDIR